MTSQPSQIVIAYGLVALLLIIVTKGRLGYRPVDNLEPAQAWREGTTHQRA